MTEQLFDVLAVNISDGLVKWIVEGKSLENARAIVSVAVMRQIGDKCFFAVKPAGKYQVGDAYRQEEYE